MRLNLIDWSEIPTGKPGQCPDCGTWRPDGQPPTVHRYRCRRGPDGSELGVQGTGTHHKWAQQQQDVPPAPRPARRRVRR